jgi:hypothetical protein
MARPSWWKAHGRAKPFISWPGRERYRDSATLFEGIPSHDLKTSYLGPTSSKFPSPLNSTRLETKSLNTWVFGGQYRAKLNCNIRKT